MKIPRQLNKYLGSSSKDSLIALFFLLATAILWILLLDWRPGLLLSHGDADQYVYPYLYEFTKAGKSWQEWIYDPRLMGGTKPSASYLIPTYINFFISLGLSATAVFNLGMFFLQFCFGYLGLFCTVRLTNLFQDNLRTDKIKFPAELQIFIFLLHALCPFLAWRIDGGQIVYFMLFLHVLLALYLGLIQEKLSAFQFFFFLFIYYNTAQTISYPLVMNAIIFGAPIIFFTLYSLPKPALRPFLWILSCIILCTLAAMPVQIPALTHFTSSDAARSLNSAPVVYAYLQGTWNDWISSIPWHLHSINNIRPIAIWPEVNHAFGPLLICLFFLPKKARKIGLGFLISFILIIAYANDLQPISSLLFKFFPMLLQFRVPTRAAFVIGFLLPTIATTVIAYRYRFNEKLSRKNIELLVAICVFSALALLVSPAYFKEIIGWLALILFLKKDLLPRSFTFPGDKIVYLFLVLFISGSAFMQRLAPPGDYSHVDQDIQKFRESILQQAPQLANPLSRAQFLFTTSKFYSNTPYSMGISSLDGYSQPQSRYSRLLLALEGQEFNPQAMNFNISQRLPIFQALRKIYNVCCEIALNRSGPVVTIADPVDTSLWFSQNINFTKNFFTMAKILSDSQKLKKDDLLKHAYFVEEDSIVQKNKQAIEEIRCKGGRVLNYNLMDSTFHLEAEVETPETCLLNMATNFSENLFAVNENNLPLITLPNYGSIFSVIVPAGTKKISVFAKDKLPSPNSFLYWLFFLVPMAFSILAFKKIYPLKN